MLLGKKHFFPQTFRRPPDFDTPLAGIRNGNAARIESMQPGGHV